MLCPESRYITAFSTILYQYKRLAFGINSAAEVSNIIRHTVVSVYFTISTLIMWYCQIKMIKILMNAGTVHLIIYSHTCSHYYHGAKETWWKWVNLSKCEFAVPEIKFFGHKFSSKGLAPDPKKVIRRLEVIPHVVCIEIIKRFS